MSSIPQQITTERKRRLRFSVKDNQVRAIPHINDISVEEVRATWYVRADYDAMKQSFIPIIRSMMRGDYIEETNEQTVRGLEYRTRQGAIRRQHNKLEAISAVLDEQDRQYNTGELSDELLSQVYKKCADHCQEEAHQLALQDEEFMAEIRKETDASVTESESDSEVSDEDSMEGELAQVGLGKDNQDKTVRRISKIFKQVRLGRRTLEVDQMDRSRGLPQAA